MIPSPQIPVPAGKGKIAQALREARKAAMASRATGRGVSYGPLGTSVRPPRRTQGGGASSAPTWL